MQTKIDRLIDTDALEKRTLEPVVKLLLMAVALVFMWALVSNLPGIDAFVPQTAVTYGAVVGAMLTLGIVAVLTTVAFRLEPLVVQLLSGPSDVVDDAASIATHVVLFVAVVTAYRGLAPLVVPSLDAVDLVWTYDMLFLAVSLVPMGVIALKLAANLDEVASLISERLTSSADDGRGDGTESNSVD